MFDWWLHQKSGHYLSTLRCFCIVFLWQKVLIYWIRKRDHSKLVFGSIMKTGMMSSRNKIYVKAKQNVVVKTQEKGVVGRGHGAHDDKRRSWQHVECIMLNWWILSQRRFKWTEADGKSVFSCHQYNQLMLHSSYTRRWEFSPSESGSQCNMTIPTHRRCHCWCKEQPCWHHVWFGLIVLCHLPDWEVKKVLPPSTTECSISL